MTEISTALPREYEQCRKVLCGAFVGYIRALGRTEPPLAAADLPDALAEARVLVAKDDRKIIGLLVFRDTPPMRSINSVAVAPDRQGQGIGSALIRAAEHTAMAAGLTALELSTAELMQDRIRLYERLGFRTIRRALPSHGRDNCMRVFMRKDLAAG